MTHALTLTGGVADFVAHKRALARKYEGEAKTLALFVRCLAAQEITDITAVTPQVIEAFLVSRPRTTPRSYNHLLGVLRVFFGWCVDFERCPTSPVRGRPRRATRQRLPFIFDLSHAQQLVTAAATLPDGGHAVLRGTTYATAFAVLYGVGLRVGELARLTCADLDLERQLLVIRETKFGKSRLVPVGPHLWQRVLAYRAQREQAAGHSLTPEMPLFSLCHGRPVHPGTFSQTFHHLVTRLGWHHAENGVPPRLHDLRHSFAVGTLLRWYRTGDNPAAKLWYLSTFLGHVDLASTAVYLTFTPQLMDAASARYARLADPRALAAMLPSVEDHA